MELELITSNKYRTGFVIITNAGQNLCHEWSNGGGKSRNVSARIVCAGCRRLKTKKQAPEGYILRFVDIFI